MLSHKNPNIHFIIPYPLSIAPGQRFRFEQYLDLLISNGFTLKFSPFLTDSDFKILYTEGNLIRKIGAVAFGFLKRILTLISIFNAEYVFLYREATPIGLPIFEWIIIKILRKKVIYDFDDAIWLSNTSKENRLITMLKWHYKVKSICKWSYKLSCGNRYLYDFACQFNRNVILNPTTIDTEHLHNPALYDRKYDSNSITIGWTGTHSTLKYLDSIESVLVSVEEKFRGKIKFLIIADKRPPLKMSFQFMPWSIETEIDGLLKIDIGIMPLTDDIWAQGKCGFKILQYMSLEIPAVASPVGVNTSIINHGVDGFLCKNEGDWLQTLSLLIQDKELRKQIGKKGREKVIKSYSVESNTRNFLSLFS